MRKGDAKRGAVQVFGRLCLACLFLAGAWNLFWRLYSAAAGTPLKPGPRADAYGRLAGPPWADAKYSVELFSGRWWWTLSSGFLFVGFVLMVWMLWRRGREQRASARQPEGQE
jgi:cbb3-type cytochrome oxidase subunit 3